MRPHLSNREETLCPNGEVRLFRAHLRNLSPPNMARDFQPPCAVRVARSRRMCPLFCVGILRSGRAPYLGGLRHALYVLYSIETKLVTTPPCSFRGTVFLSLFLVRNAREARCFHDRVHSAKKKSHSPPAYEKSRTILLGLDRNGKDSDKESKTEVDYCRSYHRHVRRKTTAAGPKGTV